jgi:AbrB family looped-hinge helix DNA binding protein
MKNPARFPGRAEHSSQACSFLLESRCKRYSPEVVDFIVLRRPQPGAARQAAPCRHQDDVCGYARRVRASARDRERACSGRGSHGARVLLILKLSAGAQRPLAQVGIAGCLGQMPYKTPKTAPFFQEPHFRRGTATVRQFGEAARRAQFQRPVRCPTPLLVRRFCLTSRRMNTLTVTAKGQITLRRELLKHLGVQPGDKIVVDKLPDGRIEMKPVRPTGKISDVFDIFKKSNRKPLSIEQINEIARRGWAGRR